MTRSVDYLVERLRSAFEGRRLDEMVELFSETLPIYMEDAVTVRFSRDDTAWSIRQLVAACDRNAAPKLNYEILSVDHSQHGQSLAVRLMWFYQTEHGETVDQSEMTYYWVRQPDGVFRVVMIDYKKRAFKDQIPIDPNRLN